MARSRTRTKSAKLAGDFWRGANPRRPLTLLEDHGPARVVTHKQLGHADRTGWAGAFLDANRPALRRIGVEARPRIDHQGEVITLKPGSALGAAPLLHPASRKVVGGVLVAPRFGWSSVGRVLSDVGFVVEPGVLDGPMVPGSAQEVPPWVLAGPVLSRIEKLLRELTRGFSLRQGEWRSPRGTVDWGRYARRNVPTGRWTAFPGAWPELQDDPWLLAAVRWTVRRVLHDLERTGADTLGLRLLAVARQLEGQLGPGPTVRPTASALARFDRGFDSAALFQGLEAMQWIADERGLGGRRALDGLSWRLQSEELWEAWVAHLVRLLGRRLGARVLPPGEIRRPLAWSSRIRSLQHLAPDAGLEIGDHTLWFDAKYKRHVQALRYRSWREAGAQLKSSHRADVHQALAYASISRTPRVTTALVYPIAGDEEPVVSVAHVAAGERRVRLVLVGAPFGFGTPGTSEATLGGLEAMARA